MDRLNQLDFQQVFESSPALQLLLSPALVIIGASQAYLDATMTQRDAIMGRYLFDVFPDNPDEPGATGVSNLRASLEYVLQHHTSHTMAIQKYDIRRPDGVFEERYWQPVNKPVLDATGNVHAIIHQVENVTREVKLQRESAITTRRYEQQLEQINRELEEQVNEKTAQLTGIFERITDGFIALDKDFRYTYVNKKIGQLLNREPASLIGRCIWDVFPDMAGSPTHHAFLEAFREQEYKSNTDHYEPLDLWQENHIYPSPEGISVFIRDISERMQTENELRASEQKYRFLFESNPMPMWMFTLPERKFMAVNESAIRHYGYSREEFLSMTALDIRPPEDRSKFMESLQQITPGIFNAGVWRHRKKDGTIIHVEIIAHDTFLEGKPARLVLAHDVTERLKAEAALRQREEVNRLIMSSSLNAIVCINPVGEIIFWNPQAEKIFGWRKEEIMGEKLSDTIVPPKYREAHTRGLAHYLQTGEGPLLERLIEITAMNKKGVEFPVELSIIPVKEDGNEFFCSFIQDITERKKSEEALRQSHEQLRQLASHLQDVREEEQKRIAREVHDELGQQVTGLKMDVSWISKRLAGIADVQPIADKLKEMGLLLDAAVKTIRKIASELRPSILDDLGLVAALEWQTREFEKRFSIPVEFQASEPYVELDPAIATGLFRLYQESLTNVARHAQARSVKASLDMNEHRIVLTVSDNGKGFDVTPKPEQRKTLGLLGMKERALMMSGELQIQSQPGKGTTVTISVPVQQRAMNIHKQN